MIRHEQGSGRTAIAVVWVVGLVIGIVVGVVTSDVILGMIAAASFIAIGGGLLRLWTGGAAPRLRHP